MKRRTELAGLLTVFACVYGSACGKKDGSSGGCGGSASKIPDECTLTVTDANNYAYTADLTLDSVDLVACSDATIDWSQLNVDYRGRPVDPTKVTRVTLAKIDKQQADLIEAIDTNGLQQSDIVTYGELKTNGQTSAQLTEFSILGNFFNPSDTGDLGFCEADDSSWLATVWSTDDRGIYEILSSMFVVPSEAETENTTATFTNDTASLAFTVDLESLTPLQALSSCEDYALDWSGVATDVNGAEFSDLLADTLRIAHVPGTVADVESQFLQLDIAADQTYFLTSYGVLSVPSDSNPDETLFQATSTDGDTFSGFTADGTWIIDLECTALSCFSPAPLVLTSVEVK